MVGAELLAEVVEGADRLGVLDLEPTHECRVGGVEAAKVARFQGGGNAVGSGPGLTRLDLGGDVGVVELAQRVFVDEVAVGRQQAFVALVGFEPFLGGAGGIAQLVELVVDERARLAHGVGLDGDHAVDEGLGHRLGDAGRTAGIAREHVDVEHIGLVGPLDLDRFGELAPRDVAAAGEVAVLRQVEAIDDGVERRCRLNHIGLGVDPERVDALHRLGDAGADHLLVARIEQHAGRRLPHLGCHAEIGKAGADKQRRDEGDEQPLPQQNAEQQTKVDVAIDRLRHRRRHGRGGPLDRLGRGGFRLLRLVKQSEHGTGRCLQLVNYDGAHLRKRERYRAKSRHFRLLAERRLTRAP